MLSHLQPKNAEGIAYLLDQDRQPLQKFVGQIPWAWTLLSEELVRQVVRHDYLLSHASPDTPLRA